MNYELFIQLLVNGIIVGTLYGVVSMCLVLIYKSTQVMNFAQGEFLVMGAWICLTLVVNWNLPFYLAFLVCLVFMVAFGIIIQLVIIRPLMGEPVISVVMVTVGLATVLQSTMNWIFGSVVVSFPPLFGETPTIEIGLLHVEVIYLLSLVLSVCIMIGFFWFFKYSRHGLSMRATAFNQQVAQSLGISVPRVFALSWAISAMVAGMAGVIIGVVNGVSNSLATIGIKVFPAVVVGGLESIVGAVLGGVIVGVLENMAEFVDGQYLGWGNLYTVAPFYVLMLILMFRPQGFFGTEDIERV